MILEICGRAEAAEDKFFSARTRMRAYAACGEIPKIKRFPDGPALYHGNVLDEFPA